MKRPLEEVQAAVFKGLGHPTRVKIVSILCREGPKCVCELVEHLALDQSTVSKHLSILRAVGIVRSTKRGLNVRYEIEMPCVGQFLKCVECVYSQDLQEEQCWFCRHQERRR